MENEKLELIAKELDETGEIFHLSQLNLIYIALREKFGAGVDAVIKEAVGISAEGRWRSVAAITGDNSLGKYMECQFGSLPSKGWEFTSEKNDGKICFKITKCPKYDFAKAHGAEKIMFLLACATDTYNVKGFNPDIGFERTKTLMEGHDCCDHCYFVKEGERKCAPTV